MANTVCPHCIELADAIATVGDVVGADCKHYAINFVREAKREGIPLDGMISILQYLANAQLEGEAVDTVGEPMRAMAGKPVPIVGEWKL